MLNGLIADKLIADALSPLRSLSAELFIYLCFLLNVLWILLLISLPACAKLPARF